VSAVLTDTTVPDPPSEELLARVGLSDEEYALFCKQLGRKPNVVELGICGAMWSEHCAYKSSKRHLKTFPTTGPRVIQGPGENAGVMDIGNGWAVVFKIESHNHPSAVEPFQGAATGVGGIIRDIFAMGARPLALLNSLRFGDLALVEPVGIEEGSAESLAAAEQAQAEAATAEESRQDAGAAEQIPWTEQPYVVNVSWMTQLRKPLFARTQAARGAVGIIRELQSDSVHVQAYCVLPDQVLLILWLPGGNSDTVDDLVIDTKLKLTELVADQVTPGHPAWETSYRATRLHDQTELDETVKRTEYSPVLRQLVARAEDYNFVSRVWKYGSAFGGGSAAPPPRQPLPFCPGVTIEQAARNRYLLSGVVSGIAHYGNCIGIPTVGGEVAFDPSYSGNCLVNAMCVGLVRSDKLLKGVAAGPGNVALIVGAKTGRDGVQGATFASADLSTESHKDRPAVQVGDPFMEKLLLEATLEVASLPGLVGVQDFGAAGLTCSGVEMAARAGTGLRLDLDAVPQRATDLSAYEMMLSESQERMMVVVDRDSVADFVKVFQKWDLPAVVCGEILEEQQLVVLHKGEEVARLPNQPLANAAPDYDRPIAEPEDFAHRHRLLDRDIAEALARIVTQEHQQPSGGGDSPPSSGSEEDGRQVAAPTEVKVDAAFLLRQLLAHPAIASKRAVYRQYDHMVRTNTVLAPGEADAAVIRIKETGQGLALCTDGSGRHCYLDPALGGARAVLEAARNILATGAQPIGVTNNLNFGNPQKPDRMWQLVKAIEGIGEACRQLETPVTGGNVSLYNETGGRSILPTPVIGMVGLLDDARHAVPGKARHSGLEIYLLGASSPRLAGSALLFELGRCRAGELEKHDYGAFKHCSRFLLAATAEDSLKACHDISDGGLAVALTEFCAGAEVELPPAPEFYERPEHNQLATLFGEEGHRWLVAIEPDKRGWLRTAGLHYSVPLAFLGVTTAAWPLETDMLSANEPYVAGAVPDATASVSDQLPVAGAEASPDELATGPRLLIRSGGKTLINADMAELHGIYAGALEAAWTGEARL
jgi:phosphoribosylformylglycinamidine (FGAM) synthase-like enzyme